VAFYWLVKLPIGVGCFVLCHENTGGSPLAGVGLFPVRHFVAVCSGVGLADELSV